MPLTPKVAIAPLRAIAPDATLFRFCPSIELNLFKSSANLLNAVPMSHAAPAMPAPISAMDAPTAAAPTNIKGALTPNAANPPAKLLRLAPMVGPPLPTPSKTLLALLDPPPPPPPPAGALDPPPITKPLALSYSPMAACLPVLITVPLVPNL